MQQIAWPRQFVKSCVVFIAVPLFVSALIQSLAEVVQQKMNDVVEKQRAISRKPWAVFS